MCFGIWKDFLIVRMDKEQGEESLKQRNVRPFDITGKPMAGWACPVRDLIYVLYIRY
jgi:hypothetical protein